MEQFQVWANGFTQTVFYPILIGAIILIAGFVLRRILYIKVSKWAQRTKTALDDTIIVSGRQPSVIWIIILATYGALEFSAVPDNILDIINKTLLVLAIISITLFLANLSVRLIRSYSTKVDAAAPVSSITQNIARVIILGVGILIILRVFDRDITPVLATLGIGGLAVALALQDTLSNLFAGFYIALSRQIKIGDYVKLDTGEEGYVTDIHWRTTTIRALANNIVLVPNERLAKAIVINYHLPQKDIAVLVNLGVHYRSDLNKVERVTIEVARETMKEVTGGMPEFEPFIRYNSFGEFSVNFTVIMRAREFTDQYLIKHEFLKRLHERYNLEGIVIPYPIRAINYEQEKPAD